MTEPLRQVWAWLERQRSRRLLSEAIPHGGLTRHYLLYVPRHAKDKALPLVLVFHGGAGQPRDIAQVSGMHLIAEREGFIVAYPAGMPGRRGLTWNPGGRGEVDDVGFVRALLDRLCTRYNVDRHRVYAVGMSIGGSLVYQLACSLAERFAAIAVIAGVMLVEKCKPTRPVSVIHIHGTADKRVPLEGGRGRNTSAGNYWPSVSEGIERWCEFNRCSGGEQVVRLIEGLVGHRRSGSADVELWLVEGGRHVWPGGATGVWGWWRRRSSPIAFSASEKVWNFFAAHPQRESERGSAVSPLIRI